jgi:hypothetical protein
MNGCRPESLRTALPSGEEEVLMSFVALGGAYQIDFHCHHLPIKGGTTRLHSQT